jgi:nucleoside-diphosphate-sugar epimerase
LPIFCATRINRVVCIFNPCGPRNWPDASLASSNFIIQALKVKISPLRRATKQRQPDITLARAELGWQATVSLEQSLELTILYFRAKLACE